MAPIPSTTGTIRSTTDATFNTADDPVDITFDCGSDADRLLVVSVQWDGASAHVLPDGNVLYNSVAMTAMGATVSDGSARKRSYYLVAPATGSNTLRVDPTSGAGDEDVVIEAYCYSGVDQITPVDGYTTANGLDSSAPYESAVTITSASGDLGWFSHGGRGSGATGGTATGFTERLDNVASNIIAVSGDIAGDTSLVTSVAFAGVAASINWIAHGININASAAAGPVIDTQPTAQTAILAGPAADASVDFTVAATTSGGALVYDWELETSVGGGAYSNVANGSGATFSGGTSATCSVTLTATTLSGRRMRCNVTDDNGTTTTDAVALTIRAGDTLTAGSASTNASGELASEATLTSDYAASGRRIRITRTAGGVVIGTHTVWIQA